MKRSAQGRDTGIVATGYSRGRYLGAVLLAIGLLTGCDRAPTSENDGVTAVASGDKSGQTDATPAGSAGTESQPTNSNDQETKQVTILKVLKKTGPMEQLIGKITFEGASPPTLAIEEEGTEGEKLRADWEKVAAKEKLPMEVKDVVEEDGDTLLEMNVELVPRGDGRYPYAVWSFLETHYGYLVDEEQD